MYIFYYIKTQLMNQDRMDNYILCIDRHCTSEKRIFTLAHDAFAHGGHRTESLGSIFRRTRVHQGMTRQELIRRIEDERENCVSRYRAQVEEIAQGLIREIPQQVDENMQQLIRILQEPREDGLPNLDLLNSVSPYFHTLENDVDVENSNAQANSFAIRVPRTFSQFLQPQPQSVKAYQFIFALLILIMMGMGIGVAIDRRYFNKPQPRLCPRIKCDQCKPCEVPPKVCPQFKCPQLKCPSPVTYNPEQCEKVQVSDYTPIDQSFSCFYGKSRSMLAETNITKNERIYLLENLAKHAHDKRQSIYDYKTLIALNPKDEVEYYQAIADLHRESDQLSDEYKVLKKVKQVLEREYGPHSILTAESTAKMANLERNLGFIKRYHSSIQLVLQTLQFFKPREYMNSFWFNWLSSIKLTDEQLALLRHHRSS